MEGPAGATKPRKETLPPGESLAQVISHPVRVRILEVLNEQDLSPSDFVKRGHLPPHIARGRSYSAQLTLADNHFKVLLKAGCVEVVSTGPVRGATENTYRGLAVAYWDDASWAEVPYERRTEVSRVIYQHLVARIESAMLAGTFDKSVGRTLAFAPLRLDSQGWSELQASLAKAFFETVEEIAPGATERLEENGEDGLPATFALLGFESPERKGLPRYPAELAIGGGPSPDPDPSEEG